ncbi:HAD-IIA family hydrolase [Micromonospora sp. NPDC050276]|uniref:HAD-IIA family hydrolase n=1 Tax=Micromonospora sp. NPDC050276 TaxID=3364278 RepID=UPI0037BDE4FA
MSLTAKPAALRCPGETLQVVPAVQSNSPERAAMSRSFNLDAFGFFLFDLDGVVYSGNQLVPGAADVLDKLDQLGKRYLFITNHTKYTKLSLAAKLGGLGIDIAENLLLTANDAVMEFIAGRHARPSEVKIHLIGSGGIGEELSQYGFELTSERPNYVVIGWDPEISYEKLYLAARNVREGAVFVVTSPDRYIPSERGWELGFGALGASIAYATGRDPIYVGKPYPSMISAALARLGAPPELTVIVGDTPETDIRAGHLSGLGGSLLVLTGNAQRSDLATLPADAQPTLVLDSILDIGRLLP